MDAWFCQIISIAAPTEKEKAHHYPQHIWRRIPRAHFVTIYDLSWYGPVLVERKAREEISWNNYKITEEDWHNRGQWKSYEVAMHEMVARTCTHKSPWVLVPANDDGCKLPRVYPMPRVRKSFFNSTQILDAQFRQDDNDIGPT